MLQVKILRTYLGVEPQLRTSGDIKYITGDSVSERQWRGPGKFCVTMDNKSWLNMEAVM